VKITEHPLFATLLPFLYIRRGHDGVNGARHRIEVAKTAPPAVLEIHSACAYCGAEIANVREDARGAWTFNVSCPLDVDMKCARMPATTKLCSEIRELMTSAPARPGGLF
jgi:hypothetical protein